MSRKGYTIVAQQKKGQAKVCVKVTLSGGTKPKQIVVGSVPPEEVDVVTTHLRMFLDEAWLPAYSASTNTEESRTYMDGIVDATRTQLRAISQEAGYAGKNRST